MILSCVWFTCWYWFGGFGVFYVVSGDVGFGAVDFCGALVFIDCLGGLLA